MVNQVSPSVSFDGGTAVSPMLKATIIVGAKNTPEMNIIVARLPIPPAKSSGNVVAAVMPAPIRNGVMTSPRAHRTSITKAAVAVHHQTCF